MNIVSTEQLIKANEFYSYGQIKTKTKEKK